MERLRVWFVVRVCWLVLGLVVVAAGGAQAHPVPFSYIDVRIDDRTLEVSVVAHVYDLSHDLGLDLTNVERLLDPTVLEGRAADLAKLFDQRLILSADGRRLAHGPWSAPEPLMDRASVRMRATYTAPAPPGVLSLVANVFPYDPQHQTFVNIYEGTELRNQVILGGGRYETEYFTGSRQGTWAVVRKFVTSGVHHILIGPDHVLFLVGLLLLGGSLRQLAVVVTGFTIAHSITLTLAALNLVTPPATLIEPAIALSIVYVGVDNLMVRGGRDVRAWIAFGFGFVHGFGFASVLREMDLPPRALGWSLFSFNLGVEIGQLLIVIPVAGALGLLRSRHAAAGRWVAVAGSVVVIAAGAFWFVQRVFFPGGTT